MMKILNKILSDPMGIAMIIISLGMSVVMIIIAFSEITKINSRCKDETMVRMETYNICIDNVLSKGFSTVDAEQMCRDILKKKE